MNGSGHYTRLVPGGKFALVSMGLCAMGIMVGQAALDSKLVREIALDTTFPLTPFFLQEFPLMLQGFQWRGESRLF